MATCPHCHAFLSDNHICDAPKRKRVRRLAVIIATGVGATVLVLVLFEDPLWALSAGVIGWMAAKALTRD
jgi:uncharacterized membrane protein YccC